MLQWDKWSNVSGDYVRSDAYHLLHMYHLKNEVRIQFSASECFLPYFLKFICSLRASWPSECHHICNAQFKMCFEYTNISWIQKLEWLSNKSHSTISHRQIHNSEYYSVKCCTKFLHIWQVRCDINLLYVEESNKSLKNVYQLIYWVRVGKT